MNTPNKRSWAGLIAVAVSLPAVAPAEAEVIEVQKLTASDAAQNDGFGGSVAVSGHTAVAGAKNDDDNGLTSGSAYVFYRDQGGQNNWGEVKKITASDGAAEDAFGRSVALWGDLLVVGAPSRTPLGETGSAYIFYRNQGGPNNWGEVTKITASDAEANDLFGNRVAISGEIIAVGAYLDDDACPGDPGCNSGSVYIFYRDQGGPDNWGEVKKLTASDAADGDQFGRSATAVSGDIIVVGALSDDDAGSSSGSAYVFYRNEGGPDNWGEVKKLTASDAAAGDLFGFVAAVSGDTIVVGAVEDNDAAGSAYIFCRNHGGPDNWGEVKKLKASDGAPNDGFGGSVAVSVDLALVGAPKDDDAGSSSGSAYVFARHLGGPDNWGELTKLTASDAMPQSGFGGASAMDGNIGLVGAASEDSGGNNAGAAYVFQMISLCPWDLDGDGAVGINDFLDLLAQWGTDPGGPPDFDGNGTVGINDFLELLANWGSCP